MAIFITCSYINNASLIKTIIILTMICILNYQVTFYFKIKIGLYIIMILVQLLSLLVVHKMFYVLTTFQELIILFLLRHLNLNLIIKSPLLSNFGELTLGMINSLKYMLIKKNNIQDIILTLILLQTFVKIQLVIQQQISLQLFNIQIHLYKLLQKAKDLIGEFQILNQLFMNVLQDVMHVIRVNAQIQNQYLQLNNGSQLIIQRQTLHVWIIGIIGQRVHIWKQKLIQNPILKLVQKMRFLVTNANNPILTVKIDDQQVTTTQKLSQRIIFTRSYCNHIQILDVKITDLVHTNPKIQIRIDIVMPQYQVTEGTPFFGSPDFELFITQKKQIYIDQGLPFEGCQLDITKFVEGCAFCVRNECLHCQDGWQYIEQDQKCSPICGDQKIVQNELCDDGNLIPYDGCYQCQYSCPLFCKNCIKGKCIECEQPQNLINGLCLFVCDQFKMTSVLQYTGCFYYVDNFEVNGYYQHTIFNQDNLKYFQNQFLDCNLLQYGIFGFILQLMQSEKYIIMQKLILEYLS
ncbi:unnamed protein product [Paramecium pentaurelia]|uniref:Transmembrane protein n=1 Tax=Paramecium pentaurelia TaxID=43138 RepID=A0A8S1WPS8_9CILI|nr:unnamed protein product [Paramecium pentaurelia]